MKENKKHLTTFLMLSMLVIVSSIREKIGNKQRNTILLSKNAIKINHEGNYSKEIPVYHNIKEKERSLSQIQDQNQIEYLEIPSQAVNETNNFNHILTGQSEFLENKIESIRNNSTNNHLSKPSSYPFILSLNLLDTTEKNIANQNNPQIEGQSSHESSINDANMTKDKSSLLETNLKTNPTNDSEISKGNYLILLLANKSETFSDKVNLHAHYPIPETTEMRYTSIFSYVVFGTSFLIARLFLSLFKNSKNEYNKYFLKGMKIITNQNFLYFVMLSFLILFYTFGLLDSIQINWEYFIASLAIFGISWVLFCIIVLLYCIMISKRWDELEMNTRNSFDFLKNNIDYKGDNKSIYELYEYLILKYFFCIPQFQVFKESNLRKEINFSFYLKYCLLQNFRLFSKLSWTCWVILIFVMYIWSVFVSNQSVFTIVLIMMLIPLLGILIAIGIYFYMRRVYRKIVDEVDSIRVTTKWSDLEAFKPTIYKSLPLPNYLTKIDEEQKIGFSLHEHFHGRIHSFYEEQVIFGATGFFLLINMIQTIGFIFIAWCLLLFIKHFDAIFNTYGYISLAFIIPVFLFYLGILTYVLSISLRWYTLISSVEMKRNNKAIKKMVEYHTKIAGEMSNAIFKNFKRIYYEISIRENKNALGQDYARKMIKLQLKRFTKNEIDENCYISIDNQLKSFLNTTGNKLNESELQYMLYFLDDVESLDSDKIAREQLCDIYYAFLKFSEEKPDYILNEVLDHYFMNEKLDPFEMDVDKVRHFFDTFNEFFPQDQINYVLTECSYLDKIFSRDAFNFIILAPRKYYPY